MRLTQYAAFALILLVTNNLRAQEITVEKIWKKYEFGSANIDGFRSMKDGAHYSKISEVEGKQMITKHSIIDASAKSTVLVSSDKLVYQDKTIAIDDYFFNEDETKILITTNTTPLYRRSFSATYYLYDLKNGKIQSLDDAHQPQTLAEYSPDGQQVSYIYKNDIFIDDLKFKILEKI